MSGETALLGDLASWPSNIVPGIGASAVVSPNVQLNASALVDTGDGTTGIGVSTAIASLAFAPGELVTPVPNVIGQSNVVDAMLSRDTLVLAATPGADGVSDVPSVSLGAIRNIFGSASGAASTPNEPLAVTVALSGAASGVTACAAVLARHVEMSPPAIAGTSSAIALFDEIVGLSGRSNGDADVLSGLQGDAALLAFSTGVAAASAEVFTVVGDLLTQTIVGASSADGTVQRTVGLIGSTAGVSGASAPAFDRYDDLLGRSDGVADVSANGQRQPREYEGQADGVAVVLDVDLTVIRALHGESDGITDIYDHHLITYLGRPLVLLGSRGG